MVRRRPYPTDSEPKKKRKPIDVEEPYPTPDPSPEKASRTDLFQERTQSTLQNVGTGLTYGGVIGGLLGCFGGALGGIPGCLAGASVGAQVGMAVGGGIGAVSGVIGGTIEQLTYDEKNPESAKKWGDTTENVVGIAAAVGSAKPTGKKIIRKVDQRLGTVRPTKPNRIDTSPKTLFTGPSDLFSPPTTSSSVRSTSTSASPSLSAMQARLNALKPINIDTKATIINTKSTGASKKPSPPVTEQKIMNVVGGKAKKGTSPTQRFVGTKKKTSPTSTNANPDSPFTEVHMSPVKANNPFGNERMPTLFDFIEENKTFYRKPTSPKSPKEVDSFLKRMFGGLVSSKKGHTSQLPSPISPKSPPVNKSGWSKTKQQTHTFFQRVYNSKRKFKSWPMVRKFLDRVSFGTFGKGLDTTTIVMEDFNWMYNEFRGAGIPEPPPVPPKASTRGGKTIKVKGTRHPDWLKLDPPNAVLNKTKGGWQGIDQQLDKGMRARYWREHPSNIPLPAPVPGEFGPPKAPAPPPPPLNQPIPPTRPRTINLKEGIKKISRRGLRKAPRDITTLDQQTSQKALRDVNNVWFMDRPPNPYPLNKPVPKGGRRGPTLRKSIRNNRSGRLLSKAPIDITTLDRYTSQKALRDVNNVWFRDRPPRPPTTTPAPKTDIAEAIAEEPIKLKTRKGKQRTRRDILDTLNTLDEQNSQRIKERWIQRKYGTPMEIEATKQPPPVKPIPEITMQDPPAPKQQSTGGWSKEFKKIQTKQELEYVINTLIQDPPQSGKDISTALERRIAEMQKAGIITFGDRLEYVTTLDIYLLKKR